MKFWDASALVPLVVDQAATQRLHAVVARDADMFVWWGTKIECVSALARLEREGRISAEVVTSAVERLSELENNWDEIDPNEALRDIAIRFLRVHPLRAADALQLAAAFLAGERRPASVEIVTLDERLAAAARKEGFVVTEISPG